MPGSIPALWELQFAKLGFLTFLSVSKRLSCKTDLPYTFWCYCIVGKFTGKSFFAIPRRKYCSVSLIWLKLSNHIKNMGSVVPTRQICPNRICMSDDIEISQNLPQFVSIPWWLDLLVQNSIAGDKLAILLVCISKWHDLQKYFGHISVGFAVS